jgi:serine/threonine-protein kinase
MAAGGGNHPRHDHAKAGERDVTASEGAGALVGSVIADRYEVRGEIGSGGAAVVFRAYDRKHGRDVALKVLRDELVESMSAERFAREITIAARLTHPHILPLYDSGEHAGHCYYVTPFIEGESLRDRLDRDGALPLRVVVDLTRGMAAALDCAHAAGVVHRDIKPENILLVRGQPLVADFGIARGVEAERSARLTATGISVGTPAYMSPEQALGEADVDARSDLYSLGCVLFEMLTGKPPFAGPTLQAIIVSRFTGETPDVRDLRDRVPGTLAGVVSALMAREPADRMPSAAALIEALDAVDLDPDALGTFEGSAFARGARRLRRQVRRHRSIAAVGTVTALLAAATMLYVASGRALAEGGVRTLAVLPVTYLLGDVQKEYVADGFTESLINDLSNLRSVNVISRTSMMQYKQVRKPLAEIAREYRADVILESSLQREGERIRVNARLVRGSDEQNLWTQTYYGEEGKLLDLQRELGVAVAKEIGARFGYRADSRTIKPESEQAWSRGSSFASQWRLEEAIEEFQRAVGIDPGNAAAYAGIARAYYFRAFYGEMAALEAFRQIRSAALAAIKVDTTLGEAYGLLALVNTHFDYDWAAAEQNFERALALSPSNAQVHHDYAHFLLAMGRQEESIRSTQRSVELDPANAMLTACMGWHSLFDDRFEQALQYAADAQRLMPSFWSKVVEGWAYMAQGRHADAVESMRDARDLRPELPFVAAGLAQALARNGEQRESRGLLGELLAREELGYVSAYDVALVYAALGENDRALEWLGNAQADRSVFLVHLRWDARVGLLREDPRFPQMVQRMGLPVGGSTPGSTRRPAVKASS